MFLAFLRRMAGPGSGPGSGSGYQGLAMATASELMAEVTREYELCMSSLVFDSNMMNEANIQVRLCVRGG